VDVQSGDGHRFSGVWGTGCFKLTGAFSLSGGLGSPTNVIHPPVSAFPKTKTGHEPVRCFPAAAVKLLAEAFREAIALMRMGFSTLDTVTRPEQYLR
jgi:hypothetical protein